MECNCDQVLSEFLTKIEKNFKELTETDLIIFITEMEMTGMQSNV
jgi:hypothetical protein